MKVKTILIISLIFVIIIMFFNANTVKAASSISDFITGGDKFVEAGESGSVSIKEEDLKSASDTIYNILLFCGMAIAVIMTGILGIKFMIGSAEEKAQVKDSLVPFVIGCIVVFGAFGLWKIFVIIGNNFMK